MIFSRSLEQFTPTLPRVHFTKPTVYLSPTGRALDDASLNGFWHVFLLTSPALLRWRCARRGLRRPVELHLEVHGSTNQSRTCSSNSLKRLDARRVRGHEIRQIEFQATAIRACPEQFRDLRDTQPASEPHDATTDFLNNTDPAIHNIFSKGKSGSTSARTCKLHDLRWRRTFLLVSPVLAPRGPRRVTAGRERSRNVERRARIVPSVRRISTTSCPGGHGNQAGFRPG
jgi:hypothetical protein